MGVEVLLAVFEKVGARARSTVGEWTGEWDRGTAESRITLICLDLPASLPRSFEQSSIVNK